MSLDIRQLDFEKWPPEAKKVRIQTVFVARGQYGNMRRFLEHMPTPPIRPFVEVWQGEKIPLPRLRTENGTFEGEQAKDLLMFQVLGDFLPPRRREPQK